MTELTMKRLNKVASMLGDCVKELRFIGEDPDPQNMVCNGHHCSECEWESVNHCRDNLSFVPKQSSCPCEDGIDSKACVGCEHSEDGKREYKPYVTVEEFIQDYQERFPTAVPRPAHTMPLIWLTNKVSEDIHLVTGFNMTDENENEKGVFIRDIIWSFRELFGSWIFLDGTPCGKEC